MRALQPVLIAFLAIGLPVAPPAIGAQEPTTVRVGLLSLSSPQSMRSLLGAFREGMRELGYSEGDNLVIESRYAAGRAERLPALAAELVGLKVAIIVAGSSQAVSAAQRATTVIPIVAAGGDLLGIGAIQSLARPGGNTTGLSNLTTDFAPKLPELLLTVVPRLVRVAVLWNPSNSTLTVLRKLQAATQQVSGNALLVEARTPSDLDTVFARAAAEHVEAVIVAPDGFFLQQASQIASLTTKYRLPSISPYREITENGGLMSYGRNVAHSFRRAAVYVDKILKGAKPAELPVEQPTTLELVVNLKTAKALGLNIPASVLARADQIIE
jgi:putative ABC transport system substrate-binding protein